VAEDAPPRGEVKGDSGMRTGSRSKIQRRGSIPGWGRIGVDALVLLLLVTMAGSDG